ncbi:MAG: hypothetical protein K6B28_07465 [Lachnospiraceae bacterium]|nr:hypothetical protein [Lachnospiraceae bacterium]
MMFEVDDTTRLLLEQFQETIKSTISSIEEGQNVIRESIDEVKSSISEIPSTEDFEDVRSDVNDGNKRVDRQLTETAENLQELSDRMEKDSNKLLHLVEKLDLYDDYLNELKNDIMTAIGDMTKKLDMIKDTEKRNNIILENVADYMKLPGYKRFFKGMEMINEETE